MSEIASEIASDAPARARRAARARAIARLRFIRRLGLRARITLFFAVGALLLSALLSGTTWALTRQYVLDQRESSATKTAYDNASLVRNAYTPTAEPTNILESLQNAEGLVPILYARGEWFLLSSEFDQETIPIELRTTVLGGSPARMRFQRNGQMQLAVGVPVPAIDASYFEIISLDPLENTLESLGVSLLGASLVTTLAGAALGSWASRRVLRPLHTVGRAAEAIAGGRLDTRLESLEDPDLSPLSLSFNEMAQALQDRVERDARFASDVSHELRSPLMTLQASIAVMENQRDDLPERARAALDLMSGDIDRFSQLVEDLLEMSRFDAGVVRLELDEVHLAELVMHAVSESSDRDIPVELDAELAGVVVEADKRRLVRVIANLLDNARKYGGGATSVSLRRDGDAVQLAVEDAGAGVPEEDRAFIFDRFARGSLAGRRGASEGVGLGLALVAEHVRLHGGRVWVEDRADGTEGARFVIELPVVEASA
jgi:signal transduction histidine kinase